MPNSHEAALKDKPFGIVSSSKFMVSQEILKWRERPNFPIQNYVNRLNKKCVSPKKHSKYTQKLKFDKW